MLDGVDPPSAERPTVAQSLDDENRWRRGISGPDEISVQRVHQEVRVDRAHRGYQRLAGDLAAEGALEVALFGAEHAAPVDVDLELLEIKDLFDRHGLFLPAALRQAMRLRHLLDVDADHRLAEATGHLGQHIGVVIEGGGLHDRRGALRRIART